MLIILKHIYTQEKVKIETPSNNPDAKINENTIKIVGQAEEVERFKKEINNTLGFYGHSIDLKEGTTNLDLYAGISTIPSFTVVYVEKIVPNALPENWIL